MDVSNTDHVNNTTAGTVDQFAESIGIDLSNAKPDHGMVGHKQTRFKTKTSANKHTHSSRRFRLKPIDLQEPRTQQTAARALTTLSTSPARSTSSSSTKNKNDGLSTETSKSPQSSAVGSSIFSDSSPTSTSYENDSEINKTKQLVQATAATVTPDQRTEENAVQATPTTEFHRKDVEIQLSQQKTDLKNYVTNELTHLKETLLTEVAAMNASFSERLQKGIMIDDIQQRLTSIEQTSKTDIETLQQRLASISKEQTRIVEIQVSDALAALRSETESWRAQDCKQQIKDSDLAKETLRDKQMDSTNDVDEARKLVSEVDQTEFSSDQVSTTDHVSSAPETKDTRSPMMPNCDEKERDNRTSAHEQDFVAESSQTNLTDALLSSSDLDTLVAMITKAVADVLTVTIKKHPKAHPEPNCSTKATGAVNGMYCPVTTSEKKQQSPELSLMPDSKKAVQSIISMYLDRQKRWIRERRAFLETVHQQWIEVCLELHHCPSLKSVSERMWTALHASATVLHKDIRIYESLRHLLQSTRHRSNQTVITNCQSELDIPYQHYRKLYSLLKEMHFPFN